MDLGRRVSLYYTKVYHQLKPNRAGFSLCLLLTGACVRCHW